MKVSLYPGCSAHGTAKEYSQSIEAVSHALGIETHEIDDSEVKKGNREDLTAATQAAVEGPPLTFQRVIYSMEDKKLAKEFPDRSSYSHGYEDQE